MSASPFQVRGVVEGFYGVFYTAPQRADLLRFLGRNGFNFYLYGPKNDRQHRARWREPYPARVMGQFEWAVTVAREEGVTFAYALSPGVSIRFTSPDDFESICTKFRSLHKRGVRAFSLFMDDINPELREPGDRESYGTVAEAHADLGNRTYAWLQSLDSTCALSFCPTDYHGLAPFSPYLFELGERLHPAIDVFYTGPQVCADTIDAADARAFAEAMRRPPLIWDNYPVNDLSMQPELHIGPVLGRAADLGTAVKGLLANPMIQPEASKVPLLTLAAYLRDPASYDPERAWAEALDEVAGEESAAELRVLAENVLRSCLQPANFGPLDELAQAALAAVRNGERASESASARALDEYVTRLDEACYHLKFRMENLALRADLLPWIEVAEHWLWTLRRGMEVLRALEAGEPHASALQSMRESLNAARSHPKLFGGVAPLALAEYVLERGDPKV